jgi:transcriptional regulator with XRE-family HTH domain
MLPALPFLAAARVLANLTQVELAKRARVSVSAVKRLEAGNTDARVSTIQALTRALAACGVEFLFNQQEECEGIKRRNQNSPSETARSTTRRGRKAGPRPRMRGPKPDADVT